MIPILEEMHLDIESQVEFLVSNPDRLKIHWTNYVGIFGAVYDGKSSPGCGCPVQIRQMDLTCGIRKVDVILDGGDDEGNRIPNDPEVLFRRWNRATGLAHPERIRRKILRPFLLVRKAVIEHERSEAE